MANYEPDVGFAWWLMENLWIQFAEVARSQGLDPLIVYPKPGEVPESLLDAGIDTMVLPFPGSGLRELLRSVELIRSRRVTCIYFTDRSFTNLKYGLFRLAGVRTILNHDHTPGDRPAVRGLRGLLKVAWRGVGPAGCDLQLCVSPVIRERAIENARIPARRTAVVQNGIVPIECSEDREYAHRALGIPTERSLCITVSRAHPYKRIDFVVEVARRCVFELNAADLCFVHCGDGPDSDRLKALVERAGLTDHFRFAGRRSDVRELLCSSSYAIHPAKGEAFSLAILEYMSAGLPVLVPDIPTVRQAIRDGETGLVFREGDATQAADLLLALRNDRRRAARIGTAASREVRRNYSLSNMNKAFRDIANRVLKNDPPLSAWSRHSV